MKYLIYILIAALVAWAVWYLARSLRRQLRGECSCGGDCRSCAGICKSCKK